MTAIRLFMATLLVSTLCACSCEAHFAPQQPAVHPWEWCERFDGSLHRFEQGSSLRALRFSPGKEQLYESSCGPAALANLLTLFFGHVTEEAGILEDESQLQEKSSLAALLQSARRLGFAAGVYLMDTELLQLVLEEVRIPVIGLLCRPTGHFVIVVGAVRQDALIFDPASGFEVISLQRLRDRWSGFTLVVDPGGEGANVSSDAISALASRYEQRRSHLDQLTWITR